MAAVLNVAIGVWTSEVGMLEKAVRGVVIGHYASGVSTY